MSTENEIDRIRRVYSSGYQSCLTDTNYSWHPLNPVSLYYRQSQERAIIRMVKKQLIPLEQLKILDAGCGIGGLLRFFMALQAQPQNLYGVDLMPDRITVARKMAPGQAQFLVGNLCSLPFTPDFFDLVSSFTVFSSILDSGVRQLAARQIEAVLKPGGRLLWYDFYRGKSSSTRSVTLPEVDRLFDGLQRVACYRLHPYKAAAVARRSLFLCEILERLPLFPRTHWLALYQKS